VVDPEHEAEEREREERGHDRDEEEAAPHQTVAGAAVGSAGT